MTNDAGPGRGLGIPGRRRIGLQQSELRLPGGGPAGQASESEEFKQYLQNLMQFITGFDLVRMLQDLSVLRSGLVQSDTSGGQSASRGDNMRSTSITARTQRERDRTRSIRRR